MEDLNLHFTGDLHAITAANNLLAALLDAHILQGNALGIDPLTITWRRCLDMNDRSLRQIVTGLGGKANGIPRETGFDITAASEVMAILAMSRDLARSARAARRDHRRRRPYDGEPVTAEQIRAAGSMTVLLKDAIKPNLVQTLEGQPAFVHCGPFANIAHGNSSLVADRIALKLADYVDHRVAASASDMGMEKFLDIVCRAGRNPARARSSSSRRSRRSSTRRRADGGRSRVERGAGEPRARTSRSSRAFGLRAWSRSTASRRHRRRSSSTVRKLALEHGAWAAEINYGFERRRRGRGRPRARGRRGGEPAVDFELDLPARRADRGQDRRHRDEGLRRRRRRVPARGAAKLKRFDEQGLGGLPICMAKTHLSLSHDPTLKNAPTGFTVPVRDLRAYTGAGWLVALCGDMQRCRVSASIPRPSTSTSTRRPHGRPVLVGG